MRNKNAQNIALSGLLTSLMLVFGLIERQFPLTAAIPGVKLGLANIVTVFAVFALGPGEAVSILFCRIFLGAVFAGNFSSIFYSAAGGTLAILVTIGLRKILTKKQLWVAGVCGAIAHSIGQMAMAMLLLAAVVVSLCTKAPNDEVTALFDSVAAGKDE